MAKRLPPFALALRRLLEAQGWTAYKVGQAAGVDAAFVRHLMAGTKAPSWDVVCKLADALGVSVEEFRK